MLKVAGQTRPYSRSGRIAVEPFFNQILCKLECSERADNEDYARMGVRNEHFLQGAGKNKRKGLI